LTEFTIVLAAVVGTLAVARATRLIVDDDLPYIARARERYVRKVGEDSPWATLVECPFCVAPYVAAPAVAWFALMIWQETWTALHWAWWIVTGWAAVSYVAAMLCVRDVPPDQR